MKRFAFYLFLAAVLGGGAAAEVLVVRSGEHDGFTRLVIRLPDKVDWKITETTQEFSLSLSLPDVQFDVSQVFDRIPKDRLVSLEQMRSGTALIFSLGCHCIVQSFTEPTGFLIIDIKDSEEEGEPSGQKVKFPVNQVKYRFPSRQKATFLGVPLPVVPVHTGGGLIPGVSKNQQSIVQTHSVRGGVNASEERLIAQISRATSQGILEVNSITENTQSEGLSAGTPAFNEPTELKESIDMPSLISLSATTVFDRDLSTISLPPDPDRSVLVCLEPAQLALKNWTEGEDFSEEIGKWRTMVFGEFDKVNPAAALSLARAYLYFGFGAEARVALSLSSEMTDSSQVIKAIADLLEYGELSGKNPFEGQHACDGDVALWSVFAAAILPNDVNKDAVQVAFSRLPAHLRGYLGPRISRKFSSAGDSKMAASILRAMERASLDAGAGIELARAAVAQLHGDAETVERELSKSVERGAEDSAKALAQLVENVYAEGGAIPPELPDLAAAYAIEYRNSEAGTEMRRVHALALALDGQFDQAFEILPDLEARDGVLVRQAALLPLLELLSERADDVTFLRHSLYSAMETQTALSGETSELVARRLLDLGFVEHATLWVADMGGLPESPARQMLRAEISLARRLPHRATFELAGLSGPEAARLRAFAMRQSGDYRKAGQMSLLAEDFDAAARGFWLAEEWNDVPEQSDAHYVRVSAGAKKLQENDPGFAEMAPLAQARALMQNSLAARTEVSSLLQAVPVELMSQ